MKFDTIVAPTIGELFEQKVQTMILSGELNIGEKLPTEQELAQTMKISKSAVHIGIKNLERQGFLRIIPRHGVYVANYPETGNIDTLIALLKYKGNHLDYHTVSSILKFREGNEGVAISLFIKNHLAEHIQELRMYIEKISTTALREDTINNEEIAQIVFEYHLYIGLKSGNMVIPMVMNAFHDISIIFWKIWVRNIGIAKVLEFLTQFTDLIEAGDCQRTMMLYRHHADNFLETYYNA